MADKMHRLREELECAIGFDMDMVGFLYDATKLCWLPIELIGNLPCPAAKRAGPCQDAKLPSVPLAITSQRMQCDVLSVFDHRVRGLHYLIVGCVTRCLDNMSEGAAYCIRHTYLSSFHLLN